MIDLQQIVTLDDLPILDRYLEEWHEGLSPDRMLAVQIDQADWDMQKTIQAILARI